MKTIPNRIPDAYISPSTEFFTVFGADNTTTLNCVHSGVTYGFENMPVEVRAIMQQDMESRPHLHPYLKQMAGNDVSAMLQRYIMCRYGALNAEADVTADGKLSEPEYVPCAKRGSCKFESKCCSALSVNGVPLSKAETAVIKLVLMPDKNIADELCVSVETVKTHFKNIRGNTHLKSKIEMAAWAAEKGII